MSCIITYKGKKYSEEAFRLLVENKFNEVSDIDGMDVYFNEKGTPTLDNIDKETGKRNLRKISKSRVLMPFDSLNIGISWDQLQRLIKEGKVDKRIFNTILAYRIPNQATSSNDSIEIVGVLPPSSGNSAIVYHEITNKTGSDFDIDKLFMLMPNYSIKRNTVYTVESQERIDFLKRQKIDRLKISDYLDYSELTGTSFLRQLVRNPDIANLLKERGVDVIINESNPEKNSFRSATPIYDILSNIEEIYELADNANLVVDVNENMKGNPNYSMYLVDVITLLDDYRQANNRLTEHVSKSLESRLMDIADSDNHNSDMVSEALKSLRTEDRVESINYINNNKTSKGKQNEFIRMYLSILESEATYEDLISPLDAESFMGNDYMKDIIMEINLRRYVFYNYNKDIRRGEVSEDQLAVYKKELDNLREGSSMSVTAPITREFVKRDMDLSRSLISIMANNMSDIAYSQIFNQSLSLDIIDFRNEEDPNRVLVGLYDKAIRVSKAPVGKEYVKQTIVTSWLMNSAVDATKDNYIVDGNFTTYTSNAGMLMFRLGMNPEQVFTILSSKAVKKISDLAMNHSIMASSNEKITDKMLIDKSNKLLNLMDQKGATFLDIFNIENMLYEDNKILGSDMTVGEALEGLWGIVMPLGKSLANATKISKPDSNGIGHNVGTILANENNLEVFYSDMAFNGVLQKLYPGNTETTDLERYIRLKSYHQSSEGYTNLGMTYNIQNLVKEAMSMSILELTPGYKKLVNDVSSYLGESLSVKEDRLNYISNAIYSYLAYNVLDPFTYANEIGDFASKPRTSETLVEIKEELYNRIKDESVSFSGQNKSIFKDFMFNDVDSSIFIGTTNIDDATLNGYKAELSNMENEGSSIVKDILYYSLLTTGLKPSGTSIYKTLPDSTAIISGLSDGLNKIKQTMSIAEHDTTIKVRDKFIDVSVVEVAKFVALKNPNDYRFVKQIRRGSPVKVTKFSSMTKSDGRYTLGYKTTDTMSSIKTGDYVMISIPQGNKNKLASLVYGEDGETKHRMFSIDKPGSKGKKLLLYSVMDDFDAVNPKIAPGDGLDSLYRALEYDPSIRSLQISESNESDFDNSLIDYEMEHRDKAMTSYNKLINTYSELQSKSPNEYIIPSVIKDLTKVKEDLLSKFEIEDDMLKSKDYLIDSLIEQELIDTLANIMGVSTNQLISDSTITPKDIDNVIKCRM